MAESSSMSNANPERKNPEQSDFEEWVKLHEFDAYWNDEKSKLEYGMPLPASEDLAEKSRDLAEKLEEPDKPYPIGSLMGSTSPESHTGPFKNAIDILVPDGTPVLASADGEVVDVVDSNTEGGPTSDYAESLNYLTIKHSNGEYSQYAHLAPSSVRALGLEVGSIVRKGEQIASTGSTGWTTTPHLHFLVFRGDLGNAQFSNRHRFKSLVPTLLV